MVQFYTIPYHYVTIVDSEHNPLRLVSYGRIGNEENPDVIFPMENPLLHLNTRVELMCKKSIYFQVLFQSNMSGVWSKSWLDHMISSPKSQ